MKTGQTVAGGASSEMGVAQWVMSVPAAARELATGRVRRTSELLGAELRMADGRTFVPFRWTVKDPTRWRDNSAPAVLYARFRLRILPRDRRGFGHWIFERVCICTTPFSSSIAPTPARSLGIP